MQFQFKKKTMQTRHRNEPCEINFSTIKCEIGALVQHSIGPLKLGKIHMCMCTRQCKDGVGVKKI